MTWNDVLIEVVNLVFKAIILLAIPYVSYLFKQKIKNDRVQKLILKGEEFVQNSVNMVQQTFVDSLKKEGKFDKEAQTEAFKMCWTNWMEMASDEVKEAISTEVGDLSIWLETMIESLVAENKIV